LLFFSCICSLRRATAAMMCRTPCSIQGHYHLWFV
jgi:hypothetical protein